METIMASASLVHWQEGNALQKNWLCVISEWQHIPVSSVPLTNKQTRNIRSSRRNIHSTGNNQKNLKSIQLIQQNILNDVIYTLDVQSTLCTHFRQGACQLF